MGDRPNLIGQRFGQLTVEHLSDQTSAAGVRKWACRCDCGQITYAQTAKLRNGRKSSCGCGQHKPIHGLARDGATAPEYWIWNQMLSRCRNPKNRAYANYGGRGIKVCERWHDFANFIADMGRRPEGLTLERIDNDRDYEPGNCKWATWAEQAVNKRRIGRRPKRVLCADRAAGDQPRG